MQDNLTDKKFPFHPDTEIIFDIRIQIRKKNQLVSLNFLQMESIKDLSGGGPQYLPTLFALQIFSEIENISYL